MHTQLFYNSLTLLYILQEKQKYLIVEMLPIAIHFPTAWIYFGLHENNSDLEKMLSNHCCSHEQSFLKGKKNQKYNSYSISLSIQAFFAVLFRTSYKTLEL